MRKHISLQSKIEYLRGTTKSCWSIWGRRSARGWAPLSAFSFAFLLLAVCTLCTLCASCRSWSISFEDPQMGNRHYVRRWSACGGHCDPAFDALVKREDTTLALDKLAHALEYVEPGDYEVASAIYWDRAVLHEARGQWQNALEDLDAAVALRGGAACVAERNLVRQRLGLPPGNAPEALRTPIARARPVQPEESCRCPAGVPSAPPPEYALSAEIRPGLGVGAVLLGESSIDDVVRIYGCDCKVLRDPNNADAITLDYDVAAAAAATRPGALPTGRRPSHFVFEDGRLQGIFMGEAQRALVTSGGFGLRSTKSDMVRTFGDAYVERETKYFEKYRYRDLGVEVWMPPGRGIASGIFLFKP